MVGTAGWSTAVRGRGPGPGPGSVAEPAAGEELEVEISGLDEAEEAEALASLYASATSFWMMNTSSEISTSDTERDVW